MWQAPSAPVNSNNMLWKHVFLHSVVKLLWSGFPELPQYHQVKYLRNYIRLHLEKHNKYLYTSLSFELLHNITLKKQKERAHFRAEWKTHFIKMHLPDINRGNVEESESEYLECGKWNAELHQLPILLRNSSCILYQWFLAGVECLKCLPP